MPRRVAFLIGNQIFSPDSELSPLQGPMHDVAALGRLLRDTKRGGFEVYEFLDKASHDLLPDIEQTIGDLGSGDFLLIYYSGHGKLDRNGRLCLATLNTRRSALLATSIPTRHLRDLVEQSNCDQVLLILDCCYSGAVDDGLRGDLGDEFRIVEDARGLYIITASTGLQVAREVALTSGSVVMGRFTSVLVNGIESGDADVRRVGQILLSDLRRHLAKNVHGQTPQFFDRRASGDPLISLSPATSAPLLDPGVLADLDADQWYRRRGAISALASVRREGDARSRVAATEALHLRMQHERDYVVIAELRAALDIEPVGQAQAEHAPKHLTEEDARYSSLATKISAFLSKWPITEILPAFGAGALWWPAGLWYDRNTIEGFMVHNKASGNSGAFILILIFFIVQIFIIRLSPNPPRYIHICRNLSGALMLVGLTFFAFFGLK